MDIWINFTFASWKLCNDINLRVVNLVYPVIALYRWGLVLGATVAYQNPRMLKSHSWPSLSVGSVSADSTNHGL